MTAPTAHVVRVQGTRVTVRCPYCGELHEHAVDHLGRPERRAPGCGLTRSAVDRLTGYTFRPVRSKEK